MTHRKNICEYLPGSEQGLGIYFPNQEIKSKMQLPIKLAIN
jgi:hypothetical protein